MQHPHDTPPNTDTAGNIVTGFAAIVLLWVALALEVAGAGNGLLSGLALAMGFALIVYGIVLAVAAWWQ